MIGLTKTADSDSDRSNGITRDEEFRLAFVCTYNRTGQIVQFFTVLSIVYSLY